MRANIRRDLARSLPKDYLRRACGASATGSGALGAALTKAASEEGVEDGGGSPAQNTPSASSVVARLVMRQEHHTGGHGTRLILNALVGPELIAAMHPLQDKTITLSAISTAPRGSAPASVASPAPFEGGAALEGEKKEGEGREAAGEWALHSYLIKLAKPEEARGLLEAIERARQLNPTPKVPPAAAAASGGGKSGEDK